jgi:glutamate-ammonia-ligase adenylyltransferase
MSYASDADAMFVMDDDSGSNEDPTKRRRLRSMRCAPCSPDPVPTPALTIDADLRPEGAGGALVRSLTAYRNYYGRWSSTWELQALVRADALAGDEELGAELLAEIDVRLWPEGGLTPAQLLEIRKLKARVEAERLPRGADPAKHTKLGPGGIADVEWTVQLLQLQHAYRLPSLRSSRTIAALRAARDAGVLDPQAAGHLEAAWTLASRIRNQIMLYAAGLGLAPSDNRELEAVGSPRLRPGSLAPAGRLPPGDKAARLVVDQVFWGRAARRSGSAAGSAGQAGWLSAAP